MLKKFPKNPYVLSKVGKFYLEVGNKMEALIHFSKVRSMLQEMTKKLQAQKAQESGGGITLEKVLGQNAGPQNELTKVLLVLVSMNDGFLLLFEGKPQDAYGAFNYI